jgi:hypothetical protein
VSKETDQSKLILEEAISAFKEVDTRINSLLQCSADDFVILNAGFRNYNHKINEITEATGILFSSIINFDKSFLENYQDFLKTLAKDLLGISKFTFKAETNTQKLIKDIGYASLHLHNLKQNLSTLKLLVTNIQLEPKYRGLYQELINIIATLYECSRNLELNIQGTQKRIKACTELIEDIKKTHFPSAIQETEKNLDRLKGFIGIQEFCSDYNENLQLLADKKSSSSAEIITNLQFQDIVRQKIEHVQEMQNNLLNDLERFKTTTKNAEDDKSKSVLKIIAQIRNIGSLQAAQLLHANSEYQKAIENITDRFEILDEIFSDTIKIVSSLSLNEYSHDENILNELKKSQNYFELELDTLFEKNNKLEYMCKDISSKEELVSNTRKDILVAVNNCQTVIDRLKPLSLEGRSSKAIANPLEQIIQSFNEIQENTAGIDIFVKKSDENRINVFQTELREYFQTFSKLRDKIQPQLQKMHKNLSKNQTNSQEIIHKKEAVLKNEKLNLGSIKYYDVFDKEIEEIISKLNKLIGKINFEDIQKELDLETIEELQKLYTMESEREVHAQLTGTSAPKPDNNSENDDIELF